MIKGLQDYNNKFLEFAQLNSIPHLDLLRNYMA